MNPGLWMLAAVGAGIVTSGLPAAFVLISVATLFAIGGVASGALDIALLTVIPSRIIGLLESDLLQALPLYVLMGVVLNRLPLASILFRAIVRILPARASSPRIAALALGALLGPMNGSVGGSAAMLSRAVYPSLRAAGTPVAPAAALVCVSSTLGVVVPPSLVLILLGDALMRAHTEALQITHANAQIINTQHVFRGALLPAALLFVLYVAVSVATARGPASAAPARLRWRDWMLAAATLAVVGGLLSAVAIGVLYAVEAAATGAFLLLVAALATRQMGLKLLRQVLADTMQLSGALFALLVAATTFTLVFRAFGADRALADLILGLHGGADVALAAVLAILALCALVLDAFEIIFVIVPVVLPPLLVLVPDAIWVAVLVLLTLQASFLVPPFGYAVMMTRGLLADAVPVRALARAIAPFLLAQWLTVAIVLAWPRIVHVTQNALSEAAPAAIMSDEDARRAIDQMTNPADDDGAGPPH